MLRILFVLLLPFILLANEDRPPIPYDFLAKKEAQHFIA